MNENAEPKSSKQTLASFKTPAKGKIITPTRTLRGLYGFIVDSWVLKCLHRRHKTILSNQAPVTQSQSPTQL